MKQPKRREKMLIGNTYRTLVGCGKLYVTVNNDADGVYEVFAKLGKSGSCTCAMCEGVTRMITLVLRLGGTAEHVAKQLKGIRCPEPKKHDLGESLSCMDAIGKVIEEHGAKEK